MKNGNRFVKLVAALTAVLLAKLLWDRRFGRSGNAGSDAAGVASATVAVFTAPPVILP